MSSYGTISPDKLVRLIGTANTPALIDVRTDEDFAADQRLIPGAVRRNSRARRRLGRRICRTFGHCRLPARRETRAGHRGLAAERPMYRPKSLEGGFEGWKAAKLPLVNASKLPPRDARGRTVWVTRARPKIDRIACPWLIRRFVDPNAVFLFVAPSEVVGVGERFNAAPFDIENVFWSHRGELCTFDVMIEEFGLATPPLLRLADHGARRRYRAARPRRRKRPACSRRRSGCRGCTTTISSSSRPACCSTTPSIAGAATQPAKPTTGRPTRQSRNGCGDEQDSRSRCRSRHQLRRSLSRLAAGRRAQLRRPGRPDRGDASHPGRGEELDLRRPLPARAELLHAAAGAGGAAACDLYRLAAAPDRAAASWPAACSSCPASSPSWA